MCYKVVSKESLRLKYCLDRYKTHEMCDNVVDTCMPALKLVPDWFVTSKIIKKLDNTVFSNGDIFFRDVDSNIITFLSDDMGFHTIDLNIIIFDGGNFDEDEPETIHHARLYGLP